MTREIEFIFSSHDDGYRAQDWFRGGYQTLSAAEGAETVAEADAILRSAYKGPDVDGVEVRWIIQ